MSNALQLFIFENQEVRVIMIDGEPWWVASDVCRILGIANVSQAVDTLDDDEKTTISITESGSNYKHSALVINEPGLYGLVFVSRKPIAKKFKRWLKHDVIPSIRKTGTYSTPIHRYVVGEGTDLLERFLQNSDRRHEGYFTMLEVLIHLSEIIHLDLLGMAPDSRLDISISKWWPKFCKNYGVDYIEGREQDFNIVNIKTGLEQAVFYYPDHLRKQFEWGLINSYFAEGYFRKWAESVRSGKTRVILIEEINRVENLVANPPKRSFIPKKTNRW